MPARPQNRPVPDDDVPYAGTPPQPVDFAEQALLGALLIHPALTPGIRHVTPEHFTTHVHGSLFAAIQQLAPQVTQRAGESKPSLPSLRWINEVFTTAVAQARGLTLPYLHQLVSSCPEPAHAAAYARMIQTGHARRSLHTHADRLAHTAADTRLPAPATTVAEQCARLLVHVEALQQQIGSPTGTAPRTTLPEAPEDVPSDRELACEQGLLAGVVRLPDSFHALRALRPEDFALPLHGGLYRCLTAMAHRGEPLDPITVLGEAEHQGLLTSHVTPQTVLALVQPSPDDPVYCAEQILQQSLLRSARLAAHHIRAYANDPVNTVHQLLIGSRRALAPVTAAHRRWQYLHHPPPPPGPATARAPVTRPARPPTARTAR
ncbi:replicative DNA helicase [Streptomyces sp. NBC_00237]|uniref:DnaB-like helicase N-terminal domain-containing protein n=1 Tax=Streptomyces sp. NBC_00237 TaxID=2975687 RepID=UPI00225512A6|nr:DnaB-like helicase N-terminal domain-containing protein [Streptomyces sp. NBC_00237]MCX5203169.1 replicative DNA helicase [Streptomyces sp. NBC_00237]